MTSREAIEYIENYTWSDTRLGLERTKELLSALGDPQKELKFIHVAGSNGKGSTCAMMASILKEAGYRTGLYISPHVQDFCERIQVDGRIIPEEALTSITERVRYAAELMKDHPSQFELVTAIAMVYFAESGCDIVVLEVGLGGALDSTNAIDAPEVAVITNIGLEHTEYLGNTLEEIAHAKSGIIKQGCGVVCYDSVPQATQVVRSVCREKNVPFHLTDFSDITPLDHGLKGQRFQYRTETYSLPLLGAHQLRNAAVVLDTVSVLRQRGWSLEEHSVYQGLAHVQWPARFEVLSYNPLFILDGGHNSQCAHALAEIIRDYLPKQKITILMGVLADKDWISMLEAVWPYAARFLCVTPDSPRALPGVRLAEYIREKLKITAEAYNRYEDAVRAAIDSGETVVAFGSLYMAGYIRTIFCSQFL